MIIAQRQGEQVFVQKIDEWTGCVIDLGKGVVSTKGSLTGILSIGYWMPIDDKGMSDEIEDKARAILDGEEPTQN